MTEKVLVLGADGYVGTTLVPKLLETYSVVALDRFYFGQELLPCAEREPRLTLSRKDVRSLSDSDFEGIDIVIDLAAMSNDPAGDLNADLTMAVNYQARAKNAKLAKDAGVKAYLLASSCSVYGKAHLNVLREDGELNPVTLYAKCNVMAEDALLALKSDSFAPIIVRQGTLFGYSPRMRYDLIVNLMTLHAYQKGLVTILGGGAQMRPLLHVADSAEVMCRLIAEKPEVVSGEIYNVACTNLSTRTVASLVREQLPFVVQLNDAPDDIDKRSYSVSADKLNALLKDFTYRSVESGIRENYDALKSGKVNVTDKCFTVRWYQYLLDAQATLSSVMIDGEIL